MSGQHSRDEKRRWQYEPLNEAPPSYDDGAGPSSSSAAAVSGRGLAQSVANASAAVTAAALTRARIDATATIAGADRTRRNSTDSSDSLDDVAMHDGHADSHRPDSIDVARRSLEPMTIEEPTTAVVKDPIHVRISRGVLRLTARVDGVVTRYVPAGVVMYFWGMLLALIVLLGVWLFGGNMPRIKVPKHYQEPALQKFLNNEVKADAIRSTVHEFGSVVAEERAKGVTLWENQLVDRIEKKLMRIGIPRHGVDDFWVYRAWPEAGSQRLKIGEFEATFDPARHYIGHTVAGNATGPIVFANAASKADLDWLREQDVILDGSIALLKRNASVPLGEQVDLLTTYNVSAAVVYWEQGTYDDGQYWPKGAIRPPSEVPLDDAALPWQQPGDVLTPGIPAHRKARVVSRHENPAMARIPVLAVSALDASKILQSLSTTGVAAPPSWEAGVQLDGELKVGSANGESAPVAEFENEPMWDKKRLIHNVMGELEGTETDQVLLVGTSLSSVSGVAVLLEVARVFAALASEHTWRPRRSVVFAFWTGTKENYLGSTEWAEDQVRALRTQGIAYVDIGNVIRGGQLDVSAVPSMQSAFLTALDATTDRAGQPLPSDLLADRELRAPHAFSDSIAYLSHVGLPTLDLAYTRPDISADCALSADCIADHYDAKFESHAAMARLVSLLTLQLIDEKFIPLDIPLYANRIQKAVSHLHTIHDAIVPSAEIAERLRDLSTGADRFHAFKNPWANLLTDDAGGVETAQLFAGRSSWNYAACQFHRSLMTTTADVEESGAWFGNVVYGPARVRDADGRRPWTLPMVEDRFNADPESIGQALEELGVTLDKATSGLLGIA